MITPISEKDWVGLSLKEAIERATAIGYIYRIVEQNGTPLMLEYSNKSNRINFRVRNDVVIGAYPG